MNGNIARNMTDIQRALHVGLYPSGAFGPSVRNEALPFLVPPAFPGSKTLNLSLSCSSPPMHASLPSSLVLPRGVRSWHCATFHGGHDPNNTIQSIAFSDGEEVHFVNTARFTRAPGRVCRRGRRGRGVGSGSDDGTVVTALAFDAVSTAVLYVGFGTGEVMVRACVLSRVAKIPCGISVSFSSYKQFPGVLTLR